MWSGSRRTPPTQRWQLDCQGFARRDTAQPNLCGYEEIGWQAKAPAPRPTAFGQSMRFGTPVTRSPALQLVFVLFERHAHQLAPRPHAGLLKQTLQNGFHVAFGNLQPPGDFLVGEPLEHEAQNLALAVAE